MAYQGGIIGGSTYEQSGLGGTVAGDAYGQLVTDASAFSLTLDSQQRDAIQWIVATEDIVAGTAASEWRVSGRRGKAITAMNYDMAQQTIHGSKDMSPLLAGDAVCFVNYVGKKLHEMKVITDLNWNNEYIAPDLMVLAEHITQANGITSMAYQRRPDSIIWATLANGDLISCTYDPEQNIVAWARHPMSIGGESITGDTDISSVQWREEAFVSASNGYIVWYDENFTVIKADAGVNNLCTSIVVDASGYTIATGFPTGLHRYSVGLSDDSSFFDPPDGWPTSPYFVQAVGLTDDSAYVYAVYNGTNPNRGGVYKFDNSDGSQVWLTKGSDLTGTIYFASEGIAVDSSDNVYVNAIITGTGYGVIILDSDGARSDATAYVHQMSAIWDIKIDETLGRIVIAGTVKLASPYHQLAAYDLDGTNENTFSIGNVQSHLISAILTDGTNIYACGTRTASGVGGANATVWKLDSSLSLLASYDTGDWARYMAFDSDGNIVIKQETTPPGGDNFWVLDTDLTLVSTTAYTDYGDYHGGELIAVSNMTNGTLRATGGISAGFGLNSVCVIPGSTEDEVWISVGRAINGSLVRYVERAKTRYWGTDQDDCFFVDSGYTYDSTPTTTITGLDHLEGETVSVLADGAVADDEVVSSGQITIDQASTVHVGLSYTYKLKPMRRGMGETGRSAEVVLSVHRSLGADYGDGTDTYDVEFAGTDLETGDIVVHTDEGYNVDEPFEVTGSDPLPCTIRALVPRLEKTGR